MATDYTSKPTDEPVHDLGPWIEAPNSSRLTRYRYDYAARQIQVTWKNGRGHVHTTYSGAESELYRKFARAVSKGRYVNSTLNGCEYRPATPDEISAPSNPNRRAVKSRP